MQISVLTTENPRDWMSKWTKIGLLNKSKEDLNVIRWHIFLSCRVLWTVKRILWKYMWRPFERALWRKICFTRLSLIILLLICFCFFHDQGSIMQYWKLKCHTVTCLFKLPCLMNNKKDSLNVYVASLWVRPFENKSFVSLLYH